MQVYLGFIAPAVERYYVILIKTKYDFIKENLRINQMAVENLTERDKAFVRDLVQAYNKGLLEVPLSILDFSSAASIGEYSYENLPEHLDEKWEDNFPSPIALLGNGYLFPTGTNRYWLTEKAYALMLPNRGTSVFISYRRDISSLQALMVSNWLWRNDVENFLDIENVDGGQPLKSHIQNAIITRSHLVCLLGEVEIGGKKVNTLSSEWVQKEIETAFEHKKLIIPFFQHDWSMDSLTREQKNLADRIMTNHGPETTRGKQYHDKQNAKAYDTALRELLPLLNVSRK